MWLEWYKLISIHLVHYIYKDTAVKLKPINAAPALSVVIAGIFDEEWLIEIEAIAAE